MARETDAMDAVGPLAFVDTETTSLDRRTGEIWEVAIVRRDPDGTEQSYEARWYPDLRHADPISLGMNGFYDRVPPQGKALDRADYGRTGHGWEETDLPAIAERIRVLTAGATLLGMVPSFDEVRLERFLRGWNVVPTWHYQPIDVEALIAGHLGVQPTYDSGDLSRAIGIDPEDYPRHTAMGDVRWTIACYDTLFEYDGPEFAVATEPDGDSINLGRVEIVVPMGEVDPDVVALLLGHERPSGRETGEILRDARDRLDRLVEIAEFSVGGTTIHGDLLRVQSLVSYLATRFDEDPGDVPTYPEPEGDAVDARSLLAQGVEAVRLTREFVGPDVLPALPGWSWFEWSNAARHYLGWDSIPADEPENPNGESIDPDLDPWDTSLPLVVRLRALAARIPREDTAALIDEAADVLAYATEEAGRLRTLRADDDREIDADSLDAAYRILRDHSGLPGSMVVEHLPSTYDNLRNVILDALVYLRDAGARGPEIEDGDRG